MIHRPRRSVPHVLLALLMAGAAALAAAQSTDNTRKPGPFERAQQQRNASTPSMRSIQQGADFNSQQPPPPVVPSQPQWRPHRPPVIVYEDSRYAPWGNAPPAAPQQQQPSRQDTPTIWYGGPLQQ